MQWDMHLLLQRSAIDKFKLKPLPPSTACTVRYASNAELRMENHTRMNVRANNAQVSNRIHALYRQNIICNHEMDLQPLTSMSMH